MPDPAVSREMDIGSPFPSRASSRSRFSSPKAAKTGAGVRLLLRAGKVLPDVLQLSGPSLVVLAVRLAPASGRDSIEPGLRHRKLGPLRYLFQLENHQCGGFGRVNIRVAARMPPPGEEPLGLHPINGDVHGEMLVARIGNRSLHPGSREEWV